MDHLEIIYRLLWQLDEYDLSYFDRPTNRSSNNYSWKSSGAFSSSLGSDLTEAVKEAISTSSKNREFLYRVCKRDPEDKEVMYFMNGTVLHNFNPTHEDLIRLATSPYKETEND